MSFLQWFHSHPYFYSVGWLTIVAVGAGFEIGGYVSKDGSTFSTLARAVLPRTKVARVAIVLAICLFLFWHFAIQKINYQ